MVLRREVNALAILDPESDSKELEGKELIDQLSLNLSMLNQSFETNKTKVITLISLDDVKLTNRI